MDLTSPIPWPGRRDLDLFFEDLGDASTAALFLDYDGTLAPFREDRERAVPWAGVREALGSIQAVGRTRLVLVSGRPAGEVVGLLDLRTSPEVWGAHGLERRLPDGTLHQTPVSVQAASGLDRAAGWASSFGLGTRLEPKHGALAVHFRGLSEPDATRTAASVDAVFGTIAARYHLNVLSFDGGIELRAPQARKSRAVCTVLSEMPAGTITAYLGDDATDEDAFRALHGRGATFLVRDPPRPTRASWALNPPGDLLAFLARWVRTRSRGDVA